MTDIDLRALTLGETFPNELYDFMVTVASKQLRLRKGDPDGAASELVHETFIRAGGFARFQQAAHGAASDTEFRGWVKTVVRNTRNSQLETDQTTASRILISISKALSEVSDRFVRMGRRWCLRDHAHDYDLPHPDVLREAAADVDIADVTQKATEDRHAPIASRDDQRALAAAILEAAGGCLDKNDLGRVIADRLGVSFGITDVEFDAATHSTAADGLEAFFDEMTVDLILDELDDAEIDLLRDLTVGQMSIRDLMAARASKKHEIETLRERLRLKLERLAGLHGMPDAAAMLTRLDEYSGQNTDLDGSDPTHE